ncbi:hypothetical protein ACOSQ3_003228 [Xanthoceras sorbifolium]
MAEFQAANTRSPATTAVPMPSPVWDPPFASMFKLKVDASVAVNTYLVGVGIVISDGFGRVRAAGTMKFTAFFTPLVTKAIAILYGVWLAFDSGFLPILMESNALCVINVLKEGSVLCSDLGLVIYDIFHVCCCLNILSFSFIPRVVNKVDDAIAKVALSSVSDSFWTKSCPHLLELLVQEDFPS